MVAELFGQCQTGQSNAHTRSGRLVHLAVHQRNLRFFQIIRVDNVGFDHLVVQVVAFTGTFTNARENRITGVHFGDVVDQFHDQNGFTNTGTTEQTDFTTLGVRCEKVDNLDACFQYFGCGRLFREFGRVSVDRATLGRLDVAFFVDGFANNVHDAAQCGVTHWDRDWRACVFDALAANQTFGRVHRDGTHGVFAKVLSHFEDQFLAVVFSYNSVEDLWQVILELHIDDGADDLCDFADCICHVVSPICPTALPRRK